MKNSAALLAPETISRRILLMRKQKIMLDADLAELYGVSTKALNQAVKRNSERFPEDFMFRLNAEEVAGLNRSQTVTGSQKHREPQRPQGQYLAVSRHRGDGGLGRGMAQGHPRCVRHYGDWDLPAGDL